MVHAATVNSVTEEGVELEVIPRVEPQELEDGPDEEAGSLRLSKRYAEFMGYRVYPQ
jgi:hypothetical protein